MPQNKCLMTRFYILFSCFFWIVTSFFFFLKWHDFTPVAGKMTILISFFVVLFISLLIGVIFALPVIYLQSFFSSKIIPFFFLVFIHFSFLILNLGVEPEFLKCAFKENSILFKLSSFVHEKIFRVDLIKFDEEWTAVGKKSGKESEYIFLFNRDVSDKFKSYSIIKSLLKENIFFVSTDVLKEKHISQTDIPSFLSRFAASQPQYMLLYKLGVVGFFQNKLRWENIDQTNFSFLSAAAKKIMSNKIERKKQLLILSKLNQKDDIYLSHVIRILQNQAESRILIVPTVPYSHDFTMIKAYSNWLQNAHVFFYNDIFKNDFYASKTLPIDCRLENKSVSRFICIFEGRKMYAFVKKLNLSRKEFGKHYQKTVFSQLFSIDEKVLKKKSSVMESENSDFFNQFDIYALDPLVQNKAFLLLPSERGKLIKANGKEILDAFNGIYH